MQIVTDCGMDMAPEQAAGYQLSVAPLRLTLDGVTYRSGVDIQPEEFYTRLKTSKSMPTTSQVSIVAMQSIFQSLVEQEYETLGIFVSSKLSGTLQSAIQAKEMLGSAGAARNSFVTDVIRPEPAHIATGRNDRLQ